MEKVEKKKKLIVCYIGQDVEKTLSLSLDSIKSIADYIIFVDGGSKDKTLDILKKFGFNDYTEEPVPKYKLIHREYEHSHKGANGRARNCYLDFIKKHFKEEWCLVLDPDEIVTNPEKIKEMINTLDDKKQWIISPKMEHLIYCLGFVDATQPEHFVPGRLFNINEELFYPEIEHPVLQSKVSNVRFNANIFTIWHLAYCKEMFELRKKILTHRKKSTIHSPQFLDWWYHSHLAGEYPVRKIELSSLPKIIKKYFMIDEDYLYFKNRGIEAKHGIMVKQWYKHFKPSTVLDLGCGRGPYLFFWDMVCDAWGLEKSDWAFNNSFIKDRTLHGDILN
ncbi:MAG: hypothetical protein DRZ76_03400, partial [Candidatus Nealsonbacteria bacterium]